jgi:hypothetical protein
VNDLEELLSSHLTRAAEAADLTPPEQPSVLATVAARRRRRRTGYVATIAAVTLLVIGVAFVGFGRSDDRGGPDPVMQAGDDDPVGTTSPSTAPPGTEQTTSTAVPPPSADDLALTAGGLGPVAFGDASFDDLVATVSERLGEPLDDTGPLPFDCDSPPCQPGSDVGEECGEVAYHRTVVWSGLFLDFFGTTPESLTWWSWTATPFLAEGLTTPEGVSLADPLDAWREAYGSAFTTTGLPDMPEGPWLEAIRLTTADGPLGGQTELGAPPTEISHITAGERCVPADHL